MLAKCRLLLSKLRRPASLRSQTAPLFDFAVAADSKRHSWWARYGVALLSIGIAVFTRWLLDPVLGKDLPFITLFGAVAVAVWFGGWRPAVAAAMTGFLAADYLFIHPPGIFTGVGAGTWVALIGYALSTGFIIYFGEAMRRARHRAEQRGERLENEITERKLTERRRNANFAITQILAESPSLNDATPRILQTIGETLGWEVGDLWIPDLESNLLHCLQVWHDPTVTVDKFIAESYRRVFVPGVGLPGRVWANLKPAWIPDLSADDNFPRGPVALEVGLHAGFAFPIFFGDKFLGVMEFFSRDLREPDDALIAMFDSIGSQIGQFMERKRAEEALLEADRRKDEFLAMLGHELRNPLGVINTVVQLLHMKGPAAPEFDELRDTIQHEVAQMARLLDDLLDVSRIARGLIRLKKEPCDLATIVRQVAENRRSTLDEGGLALLLHLPEQPLWVMGDRTRLAQIVGNLLDNANKFSESGGRVTVQLVEAAAGNTAVLTVRDTGIGMEPETLARAFEPFTQADRSVERSRGGLGLGLALVKGLVELHGGQVRASSEGPGLGSELTVRLPLTEAPALIPQPNKPSAGATRHRRVLVIEDNLPAAESLRTFLAEKGHSVEVAQTGPDGIDAARRFQPGVVLCDIGLPGLDGYAVARLLRQEPGKVPYLIAVSGYGQDADQRRAAEAGFDAYLTKPIDLEEVERLLNSSIAHDRAATA